jgi:hypothetical protein
VTATCGPDDVLVDSYHAIADRLRRRVPDAFVALNPGTAAEECYVSVGDTMVVFENTYQAYLNWTPPDWISRYPARSFWHLVYDAPTLGDMRDAIALSKQRNAGYVYVAADAIDALGSPWNELPPGDYWSDELCQVRFRACR